MLTKTKGEDRKIQIGLDIGSHTIKSVAISHSGPRPLLLSFSVVPIRTNIVAAVKSAHAALGVTSKKVITSLAGPSVVVRYVEMPLMTGKELEGASRFEAEKVIPFSIDEVVLDAVKVEEIGSGRMRVVLVAARRDWVDDRICMLKDAGLEPVALDIDSFALMNAFTANGVNMDSVCGLINIGAKITNLNILKGNTSYLARDISVGGDDINKVMPEAAAGTGKTQEELKIEKLTNFNGLSDDERQAIEGGLENVIQSLGEQLRMSLDFYESRFAGAVEKLYISGGTTRSDVVEKILKEHLGRETIKWHPMANIDKADSLNIQSLNDLQPQLAIALGLGLRKADS